MSISFSVTKSPVAGRAFGSMFGFETNPTSEVICGVSTGAEPICETTALTPNTQYFSTASNYSSIRYAISNVVAGAGSVASTRKLCQFKHHRLERWLSWDIQR
jgi:hypothetical protein